MNNALMKKYNKILSEVIVGINEVNLTSFIFYNTLLWILM